MIESGYYPAGAEFDPNAPWNQTDIEDVYGDEARERLEDELGGDEFIDWLLDQEYIEEEDITDTVRESALWKEWQKLYEKDRWDDLLDEIAEEHDRENEYAMARAEEWAEDARERELE